MTMLADKTGGMGSVTFYYRRYGTDAQVDWKVEYSTDDGANWTQIGSSFTAPASDVVQTFNQTVNVTGDVRLRIKRATESGASNNRLNIDDITITDYAGGGNFPPSISNIVQTPAEDIESTTTVSVSADVTDSDGTVDLVELHWGTATGTYPNTINMSLDEGDTYAADSDIPAQTDGTTVYYVIYAEDDDEDSSTSTEQSYTVTDPATTTIPYSEAFDTGLGDCYVYTVSGAKPWYYYSQSATANAYNGSFPEEHWLVLPGINFNNYSNERMIFNNYVRYGSIDENNYLKLFYSTDYYGIGSPVSRATWTEITFNQPTTGSVGSTELSASSGVLNLSSISGTSVYLAFKYYSNGSPSQWRVDDISIYEASSLITVNLSTLSDFTYDVGSGPSTEKTFTVSGADLENDITIYAPTDYEISESTGTGFTNSIVLEQAKGDVSETTIYVRLKAGLSIGTYNDEIINITSDPAVDKTVTCSGEVRPVTTSLSPGDLAIVAFQVDTPDQFSFVLLTDVLEGTEIVFTDNGWTDTNTFYSGEGYVTWTAPAGGVAKYTVVTITAGTPWTATIGSVSTSGSIALATAGDQLIAFQGETSSPTLLYCISSTPWVTSGTIGSNTTYLPTGLVDGYTAIDFSTEYDDQYYNIVPFAGTDDQILYSIGNEANWTFSNTWLSIPDWEFLLPVELSSFSAVVTADYFVMLHWTTQSETNVQGYYIYKSTANSLAGALQIPSLITATNTSQEASYSFLDQDVSNGTYYYWLQNLDLDGNFDFHGPVSVVVNNEEQDTPPLIPTVTQLLDAYPNPFTPQTRIGYTMKAAGQARIDIYNNKGQLIRSFDQNHGKAGYFNVIWDGRDANGKPVSSGIYCYRMTSGKYTSSKKVVLMK